MTTNETNRAWPENALAVGADLLRGAVRPPASSMWYAGTPHGAAAVEMRRILEDLAKLGFASKGHGGYYRFTDEGRAAYIACTSAGSATDARCFGCEDGTDRAVFCAECKACEYNDGC